MNHNWRWEVSWEFPSVHLRIPCIRISGDTCSNTSFLQHKLDHIIPLLKPLQSGSFNSQSSPPAAGHVPVHLQTSQAAVLSSTLSAHLTLFEALIYMKGVPVLGTLHKLSSLLESFFPQISHCEVLPPYLSLWKSISVHTSNCTTMYSFILS